MDPMGNESPYLGGPHLPIPYLFGTFGSQASFFSRVTIDLWFQIYRKLEDEGVVDANQISEKLFLLQSVDLEKEHS